MAECELDAPPLPAVSRVGIIFNLKKGISAKVEDAEAEYDSIDTVNAIKHSLEKMGLQTELIEAGAGLFSSLAREDIDIAFNIAEGAGGRGREAQVPAVLEMLGIPHTGSDTTTLAVALDKALTKRLLATYRVRSPRSVVISAGKGLPAVAGRLRYPVIVKPNAEGSSKGISGVSIVRTREQLAALCEQNLALYGGDMLAEEYIAGREFTVGLLGNGEDLRVFAPMEIIYKKPTQEDFHVYSYGVKKEFAKYVSYSCPADITDIARREMEAVSRRIFHALGCRDFARIDFRLAEDGKLYFIEINPLPGLAPGYSDYPMLAQFCAVDYDALIAGILTAAARRLGMACGVDKNEKGH